MFDLLSGIYFEIFLFDAFSYLSDNFLLLGFWYHKKDNEIKLKYINLFLLIIKFSISESVFHEIRPKYDPKC